MDITIYMRIKDILDKYPEAISVFSYNGFSAATKSELIEEVGEDLMLKTALKVKGVNDELFIKQLEEKIGEKDLALQDDEEVHKKLNFIGYTYCPLKITFKDTFEEVLKSYMEDTGDKDFKYYVPSGCGGGDPYEDLWKAKEIGELPEVIASVGFGDYFRQEFVQKFVDKGYFKAVHKPQMQQSFIDAGLVDPKGWYTVYSVFPLVMLADRKKLGNLPVPKEWSDLLDPVYASNIIVGASHGNFHEDIFLYIYKEYGDEGVIKLSNNIKNGWHASQMAKVAGTNSNEGAAIYVIPWMFAKSCPRTDAVEVIWPSDGALTTVNYILVKEFALQKYQPFVEFLIGSEYGQKSADNNFPAINTEVDNKLPQGATFKWLGWDYIRSYSIHERMEYVMQLFWKNYERKFQVEEMVLCD